MAEKMEGKYPGHHVLIAPLVIVVLFYWALAHAIITYSKADFTRYSLYTAFPIAVIAVVGLAFEWKAQGFKQPSLGHIFLLFQIAFAVLVMGVGYFSIGVALKDIFFWLRSILPIGQFTALLTLPAGLILFFFRLKFRAVYGLTETLVGMVIAAQRASDVGVIALDNRNFYLAVLTAGVYLVVRGLDNIHQGLTKPPIDPLAAKLISRFKPKSPRVDEPQNQSTKENAP
jgi:hypothetical protein